MTLKWITKKQRKEKVETEMKDEKYQIKSRGKRKYQRQVWVPLGILCSKDGRAMIIDSVVWRNPIKIEEPKDHPNQEKREGE